MITYYLSYKQHFRPDFKKLNRVREGINHHFKIGVSDFAASPNMMSPDQRLCVMTSSISHGDAFILSRINASDRKLMIYSLKINQFSGI